MRLSTEQRERILEELALHQHYSVSAIAARHGVSRWTAWRLLDRMRAEHGLQPKVSDTPSIVR